MASQKSSSPSPMPRNEPSSARLTVLIDVPVSRLSPPNAAERRVIFMDLLPRVHERYESRRSLVFLAAGSATKVLDDKCS